MDDEIKITPEGWSQPRAINEELLEALRDMVAGYEDTISRYGHGAGDVGRARGAIARAEGRDP